MKFKIDKKIVVCKDCVVASMCQKACHDFQRAMVNNYNVIEEGNIKPIYIREIANMVRRGMIDYFDYQQIIFTIGDAFLQKENKGRV